MTGETTRHTGLTLDDLRTLAYAAAFVRNAVGAADSIIVTRRALGREAAEALERVCGLAVAAGRLEVEIAFGQAKTRVRLARPGRL